MAITAEDLRTESTNAAEAGVYVRYQLKIVLTLTKTIIKENNITTWPNTISIVAEMTTVCRDTSQNPLGRESHLIIESGQGVDCSIPQL